MARVLLALAVGDAPVLERELPRHGHRVVARASSAGAAADELTAGDIDLIFVSAAPQLLDAALLDASDRAGARVIGVIATESGRRHASSIGLVELMPADADWERIEAAIARTPDAEPEGPRPGRVIAVWGPAGSPGRTSLAISIAAEIAAAGYSVALADADTHSASIAPSLGLLDESPGFAAACRLAGANSLTHSELERVGQRYLSGHGSFWVLTGIGRPSRWPELSAERVTTTLSACREWVDYTVVDTAFSLENDEEISSDLFAPRRNAATIAALRAADQVIAVGTADPVGLSRFLRAHVDLLDTLITDRLTVVMNRVRSSAVGMNPHAQVEQALRRFGGILSPVLVPYDHPAFDAAVLSGRTLRDVSVRSPARLAIGQFVSQGILPAPPPPIEGTRRGRRQRVPA